MGVGPRSRWRIRWTVGTYANVVWFHPAAARAFSIVLLAGMTFRTSFWAAGIVTAGVALLSDMLFCSVMAGIRQGSSARPGWGPPWPQVRPYLVGADLVGLLCLGGGLAWAGWAKLWWTYRGPVAEVLLGLAILGFVASGVLRVERRGASHATPSSD